MHYFILGPSGAGKSHIARTFAESIGALWLETDAWPPEDRIVTLALKTKWDDFHVRHNAGPISKEFSKRAASEGKTGVVMSLPGYPLLTTRHQENARSVAKIAYIVGTPGQCLDSFLAREQRNGRKLDIEHWARNSGSFFAALQRTDIRPLTISNFDEHGRYRPLEEIFSAITHD